MVKKKDETKLHIAEHFYQHFYQQTRKIGKTGQKLLTGSDPEFFNVGSAVRKCATEVKKKSIVFARGSTVKPQNLPENIFSTKTPNLFIRMICLFCED